MSFRKTGQVPIAAIYCRCGGKIEEGKCDKCGKTHDKKKEATEVPTELLTADSSK